MEEARSLNLIDVDILIDTFILERQQGIATLHRIFYKNSNQISLRSLIEELREELRTGCVAFINKNFPQNELHNYLFYIVNSFCKKNAKQEAKKKTEYLCPGCSFFGKENILDFNRIFKCTNCKLEFETSNDPKKKSFFKSFYIHNKNGFRCPECSNFIPHPLDNAAIIACPYLDCLFVGQILDLNKMNHPTLKVNVEKLILDVTKNGMAPLKDNIISQENDSCTKLEIVQELQNKVKMLQDIIETQSNNIPYSSSDFTCHHKLNVYKAFSNLLKHFPEEMSGYLLQTTTDHMGFQHRLFQEYIKLLDESLPFFVTKNRKRYKVDSLLDDNLNLFDGISVFDGIINEKMKIKNDTKEFYIGGRKASYTRPFYIGKLLNIIDANTKAPLLSFVKEYSFSRIIMRDIAPGTRVTVTHLRVPPHPQMGGMVYVNRIRKKIVDRAAMIMDKNGTI